METANSGTACWYWWLPVNCNLRRNKGRGWGGGNHVKMAIILSKWALAEAARQSALTVYGYVLTLVDIFDKSVMVPLLYISRLFFWQILCRSFFNIDYDLTFSMLCNNTWVPSMFPLQFDSSKWLECAQWKPCLSLAGLPAGRGIMSTSSTTIGWKRFAVRNAPELVIITFFLLFLLRKSCTDQVCVSNSPQCAPGGCLIELCIQLSIIMLGKQLIQNNIFEIGIPWVDRTVIFIMLRLCAAHYLGPVVEPVEKTCRMPLCSCTSNTPPYLLINTQGTTKNSSRLKTFLSRLFAQRWFMCDGVAFTCKSQKVQGADLFRATVT